MGGVASTRGTIAIHSKPRLPGALFPHVWMLPVTATVSGQRQRGRWRRTLEFEVAPGRHTVDVSAALMGSQQIEVLVAAGERVVVRFGGARVRLGDGAAEVEGTEVLEEIFGLEVGQRVRHERWGDGTIESIVEDGRAERAVASDRFDDHGTRDVDLEREELVELGGGA
jgi:hypothetical protein